MACWHWHLLFETDTMRLITFDANGQQRLGAWIQQDQQIVDLYQAAALLGQEDNRSLRSMQALMEGGEAALDCARDLLVRAPSEAVRDTASVRLLAPVPQPIQ